MTQQQMAHAIQATNLADILESILDKGIVIAGDIKIQIADIDLLTIIRLLIASVDKALEMGINWWQQDSYLTANRKETIVEKENAVLKRKINRLENANASRRRQEKITTQ
ncbi:MAG: gas vesicle protein [Bacteroidetes bacterium]|nr:gas vesicle protein [Bacteroidota bacterium]MBU2585713.1 gas vesicle protein [Bacteroidota bacterium]